MNKKDKNEKRIEIIKEERKEMLLNVQESIKNGNESVLNNLDNIINLMEFDDNNIKKYQAIKSAQELISKLTEEIVNTTDKESIVKLRKKLNYYINKVKKEAEKRNLDYTNYSDNIANMRKDISKYISYLKKQNQIDEISLLNSNYDILSDDDKKLLQRQISNARDYNTKERRKKDNIENKKVEKKEKINDTTEIIDNIENKDDIEIVSEKKDVDNNILDLRLKMMNMPMYESDKDFMSKRVDDFNIRYNMIPTHEYTNSIGKNIVIFLRNIHIYGANKRTIKKILFDYSIYYRGDDLKVYLDYVIRNNSIKDGIKSIFKKSALYNKENIYLDNHERCIDFIMSIVKKDDIKLNYR